MKSERANDVGVSMEKKSRCPNGNTEHTHTHTLRVPFSSHFLSTLSYISSSPPPPPPPPIPLSIPMPILSKLTPNLFPPNPNKSPNPNPNPNPTPTPPPIPIPKYPPPTPKSNPSPARAFKTMHRNTRCYKPVDPGVISSDPNSHRSVILSRSGLSYRLPGAPFDFQFSYSETPGVTPLAIREPTFLPFAPPSMPRPWTGKAPLKGKKNRKKVQHFDSFDPPPLGKKGVKYVERPGPFWAGKYPVEGRTREEVLGEPLKRWEVKMLVGPHLADNRQVNLG